MKKLTTRFLILFILLILNNSVSASFFGDIYREAKSTYKEYHQIRCKVEYTQLDLATGLEKVVKNTVQFVLKHSPKNIDYCYTATQDLTDKINKWLNESPNNIITNSTIILCKEKVRNISKWVLFRSDKYWEEYKNCNDEYNIKLIDLIDYPRQQGFNMHKERLIKDYEKEEYKQKSTSEYNND
jgi:hypothetical protein